jgi:hypothetical protein
MGIKPLASSSAYAVKVAFSSNLAASLVGTIATMVNTVRL